MAQLISEAGDPAVEPRPEHVEAVRSAILERLGPPRHARRWKPRLVAASAAATVAAVASLLALALGRPTVAWGQVAEAMQGRPWIHGQTLGPDGRVASETWFSPGKRVIGSRHGAEAEFHDLATRAFTKYVPSEAALYRLPEQDDRLDAGLDFYRQLLDEKGAARSPVPGMDVVGQSRREVDEGGRTWLDIELTLKVVAADRPPQKLVFRVDPATRLPHSCTFDTNEGPRGTTLFGYPDAGPADIFDLGVPRGLKVVDRVPGDDLERIRDGLKAGRHRFDDYRGLVVQGLEKGYANNVNRVWRKGRKWRAELIHPVAGNWPPPKEAGEDWWKAHEPEFSFAVLAICDGEKVRYYRPKGDAGNPAPKEPPPVELSMTQAIDPSDDPFMPWPHLLPEQLAHPSIWPPTEGREITAEAKPLDGPPGTIRVRVRDTRFPDDGTHPDLYKLWIDPLENYASIRTESSVFKASGPPHLEFIDTQVVEALAKSPGGYAYPTRVRRTTSNSPAVQVTRFYLDFKADIPDELFRPL